MWKLVICSILLFFSFNCLAAHTLHDSRQLLLVVTRDWNAVKGTMQRYQRDNHHSKWIVVGKPISVVVGKNGLAWGEGNSLDAEWPVKKEGDLRSPAGIFSIKSAFGFASQSDKHINIPYMQLNRTSVCVDDAKSKYYNQIINTSSIMKRDWNSGEQMRQVPQYKLGALIEYNTKKPEANAGSCIFMHIWRNADTGTAGCVAISESHLMQALYWLDSQKHPAIALLTKDMLNQYGLAWNLPV